MIEHIGGSFLIVKSILEEGSAIATAGGNQPLGRAAAERIHASRMADRLGQGGA
jgi:hypothetical protein